MIWALLAWYFFGGGGAGSGAILTSKGVVGLREQVAVVVQDESRRESATRKLKILEKDVTAFERMFARSGRQLNRLYADHEDNREEALALLRDLNTEWQTAQYAALDARFALRDEVTEEEWLQLFGKGE